ncbi:hypothetical protein E4198_20230 [Streptomyces sp. RKND-216]|uniref:hypothetical protein n=1 Tax=Streptomyces sp. RKND-216 TaxID=2562581 RepID=UPI00109E2AF3|nr:hypothetical protein [Streptomyces sp. RKND-216]THA26682.1 hypothetical protein E4198_20230 [Streptomyces sp. RKND-216]
MSEAPGGRRSTARRAVLCSVADQGVAALTNIAVLVVAARQSTAAGFAVFSVVYTVFAVLLGLSSAYVGQALVLERGETRAVRTACRSAVAFTASAAAALGACAVLVLGPLTAGVGAGGGVSGGVDGYGQRLADGMLALALVLPVVLTQDALRYAFSALRLPGRALIADLLRLAVAVPVLAVQPHQASPARLVAVWGLSALPALVAGLLLLAPRVRQATTEPRRLLRRGHLGRRFAVEFSVGNAGTQLAVIGLGLLAAPLAVGALRGATTLFGPLNVLFNAATGFGPPLLNRLDSPAPKARTAAVTGGVLAAVAGAWAVVLTLLPDGAGRMLLGDTWDASSALLSATGSQYAAMALGTCALLALRVLRPRTTLPLQVVFSSVSVGCLLAGYALGGVFGAAWGLFAGSAAKAAAGWLRAAAVVRTPAGHATGVSAASAADPAGRS